MKATVLAVLVGAGSMLPGVAPGQSAPTNPAPPQADTGAARAAYEQGVELFRQRKYDAAVAEFLKAYREDPNPVLVYNMARAFEELRDYASAVHYYREYLEKLPGAEDRPKVEETIAALERLATPSPVDVTLTTRPEGARVLVDGRELGVAPYKGQVPGGKHYLTAELSGYTRGTIEVELKAGQAFSHEFVLVPAAAPPPVASSSGRTWTWVALGTGGALLAGSAITGVLALQRDQDLDALDDDPTSGSAAKYDDVKSEGRTLAVVTDGLLVLGSAGVVTGLILLLTEDDDEPVATAVRF